MRNVTVLLGGCGRGLRRAVMLAAFSMIVTFSGATNHHHSQVLLVPCLPIRSILLMRNPEGDATTAYHDCDAHNY